MYCKKTPYNRKNLIQQTTLLETYYQWYFKHLNSSEKDMLHEYQGLDYEAINHYLRNPNLYPIDDHHYKQQMALKIQLLDTILNNAKTPIALDVYRGVCLSAEQSFYSIQQYQSPYCVIDQGFTSTTLSQRKALSFCQKNAPKMHKILYKIHLPKGTSAIWMDCLDDVDEDEFLIARNATYQIIQKERKEKNLTFIQLKLILQAKNLPIKKPLLNH